MAVVETMPLLQCGLRREPRVQQTICHIEQPRAQCQSCRKPWRKREPGRAPKSPTPQRGYSGCIQTQKVPVPQQCVREAEQTSV